MIGPNEGGGRIKSYSLLIKVNSGDSLENGDSQDENQEPSAKKRKTKAEDGDEGERRSVSAELVVYDKHSRCLLTEGEYELVLGETDVKTGNKISPKKNASWEIIDAETASMSSAQFNIFNHSPTLKFRLSWCSEPAGKTQECPQTCF